MDGTNDKTLLRNNPVFVIGISCLVAALMIFVSVFMYVRSDTRKTIEQIQSNNNSLRQEGANNETKAEATPEYVSSLEKDISKKVQATDDEADFSPDELTDSALGL